MPDDLGKQIKHIIVERCFLRMHPEEIDDEALLMEALGLDSVQVLEIIVGLEDVFGVTFDDTDFDVENFSNVAAIRDCVRKKMAGEDGP